MFGYKPQYFLLTILIIILFISCPNEEMRDLVELKVSEPVADSFIINSGAPTATRTVTLNSDVSKEQDALEMRFRNEGFSWSDWESYSSHKTWTLSAGDGIKTVSAEYRDEGHHTVSKTNSIVLNTGAPAGDFYIWGTAISGNQHEFINTLNVDLCMNIINIEDMRFSNDGGVTWSSWLPYTETYSWTLSAGDGPKTVNAEFRTNAGVTTPAQNSTSSGNPPVLDTSSPAVSSFIINSGDASVNNIGAELSYNYTDTYSVWAQYRNDGESWSTLEIPGASPVTKSWTLRAEEGTRTVEARLTDIAGNVSSVYSDNIYLNTAAPPSPLVASVTPTNDTTPTWTWNNVPGAVWYRYKLDSGFWSEPVSFLSYTSEVLSENTNHTLYVNAIDSEDRESESGFYTVYIDTASPVISGVSLNQTYFKSGDTIIVDFAVTDVSAIDSISAEIDSNPMIVNNISGSDYQASYTVGAGISDGTYPVIIYVEDAAGNSTTNSGTSAVIDKTAPVVNNFRINNGNTYSCSPYGRVTSSTAESGITMQLTGTSSTSVIAYTSSYDIHNSGSVTGEFFDVAGNVSSENDAITMKTSTAEDIRYENQNMPSHLASAAYDLGSAAADWDIHGGDYAQGGLTTHLSGEATLWDEDWYKLELDIGYGPGLRVDLSVAANVIVEAFYDADGTQPVPISSYNVSADGMTLYLNLDWDLSTDGVKTIWIKVHSNGNPYTGVSYDMIWYIGIL